MLGKARLNTGTLSLRSVMVFSSWGRLSQIPVVSGLWVDHTLILPTLVYTFPRSNPPTTDTGFQPFSKAQRTSLSLRLSTIAVGSFAITRKAVPCQTAHHTVLLCDPMPGETQQ